MGKVELTISANVQGAIDGTRQVGENMDRLKQSTEQYKQRSQQAFMSTKDATNLVNSGIDKLEKNIKELTREWVQLAAVGSRMSKDQKMRFDELNKTLAKSKSELSDLKNRQADLGATTSKGAALFKTLGTAMAGAFTVGAVVSYTKEAIQLAGKVEGIKQAFDRLNQPGLLSRLKEATRGTVSEMDLMKNAVKANNFKIPLEQLATFFEFATKRAAQTGESVDYLVDSIILGVGRKSPLILDNLGISAVALREKFKGVSIESAGIGAVSQAMGELVSEELEKMGDVSLTTQQKMEQMSTSAEELKTRFGELAVRMLTPMIDLMGKLLNPTKSAQEQFDELSASVENNTVKLVPMIDEYESLQKITDPSNDEQARMNELIQQIAKNVPTAITQVDEYGRVIGVSTTKAREFIDAQNALLVQKNAEAIEEWAGKIEKAQMRLNVLSSNIEFGKWMTDAGQWVEFSADEMANMSSQATKLGDEIKLAENAIKLLSGEEVKLSENTSGAGGEIVKQIVSLDSLKAKLEELKKQQSAAPLELFHSFDKEISDIEAQIALYEKKTKDVSRATKEMKDESAQNIKEFEEAISGGYQQLNVSIDNTEENISGFEDAMSKGMEAAQISTYDDLKLMEDNLADFGEKMQKEWEEMTKFLEDHPIAAAMGVENEQQLEQIKDYAAKLWNFANEIVAQQVEATTRIVEDQNQRIDEQQQLVNRELELKTEGLANNYAIEQENLVKMQKQRDAAIKDRERMIRIQRTMSTVESGIALIGAAANIIKGFSSIPVIGWILGIAAVGAMIAGFIAAQSKVKDATQFEHGGRVDYGLLSGRRHTQGGIPIEAEAGEFYVNRKSTSKYLPLLQAINRDDRDGMRLFFDRKFINKVPGQSLSFDIDSSKKLGEIVRELKKGKADITYGNGFIIERIGGYTKKINLN